MIAALRAVLQNRRLRGETAWVLFNKLAELLLFFAAVKLLTNLMGKALYAEYNLALTAALLVGHATIMPMQQAYLRHHHTAAAGGRSRAAQRLAAAWFALVTLGVALLAALLSPLLCRPLGIEKWTLAATGLIFLGNRWRIFGVQVLEIRRQRRAAALQNTGFLLLQVGLVAAVLLLYRRGAAAALLAYAAAAAVFGAIAAGPILRAALRPGPAPDRQLLRLLLRFGLPYGALMVCQWVQGFSERYMLGFRLDLEAAGLYIAAFQVCGVPYMLALAVLRTLLVPIAYQRARDLSDAGQLWSADAVLLGGIAFYLVLGGLALPLYLLCGPWLLRLMTSAHFALPAGTLFCLAAARYVQQLAPLIEVFFAVHQRMGRSLLFRLLGGALMLPICWWAIGRYGVGGAAGGVLLASLLYLLTMGLAPGGFVGLVLAAGRQARGGRLPAGAADRPPPS